MKVRCPRRKTTKYEPFELANVLPESGDESTARIGCRYRLERLIETLKTGTGKEPSENLAR
ncbi:MAG TPA: hypothetical protein VLD55_13870 [Candidatus Sulfobium mesophilum]|nr:hypothetical protein [Candidatus Sulfobium mesophilum]